LLNSHSLFWHAIARSACLAPVIKSCDDAAVDIITLALLALPLGYLIYLQRITMTQLSDQLAAVQALTIQVAANTVTLGKISAEVLALQALLAAQVPGSVPAELVSAIAALGATVAANTAAVKAADDLNPDAPAEPA
jgi:hypothetical protein